MNPMSPGLSGARGQVGKYVEGRDHITNGLWIQLESLGLIAAETLKTFMHVSDRISSAFQKHPFF